ncbi:serine hydrolase domain-containing protein, partial [Leucobacter sp. M11]|uniref:serine hydrolase domain-containing protein n=1 Tax=Leucobacter sp. M11 TaxID=2993565 RepID=UPI002D802AF0
MPKRQRRSRRGFLIGLSATAGILAVGGGLLWHYQGKIGMTRPANEWTFTHMSTIMPTVPVTRAGPVFPLPTADPATVPSLTYKFDGETRSLDDLHANTNSTSFVVLHRGEIVAEAYPGVFAKENSRFQLFSITKSVTSMLVGIALDRGEIESLDQTVAELVPELAGSAYAPVTLEQLLTMTTGVGGPEDWTDPDALINRFEEAVTSGGDIRSLIAGAPRATPPGQQFNYSTLDTQVLGWALEGATGTPLNDYASEHLWSRIGAEQDGYYFQTRKQPGTSLGGGSLNLSARDLARVGLLMSRGGELNGQQIVPRDWVERSAGNDVPFLQPGALGPTASDAFGYSNLWWTLGDTHGSFSGIGVHGQYLFIDPVSEVVIAK